MEIGEVCRNNAMAVERASTLKPCGCPCPSLAETLTAADSLMGQRTKARKRADNGSGAGPVKRRRRRGKKRNKELLKAMQ